MAFKQMLQQFFQEKTTILEKMLQIVLTYLVRENILSGG